MVSDIRAKHVKGFPVASFCGCPIPSHYGVGTKEDACAIRNLRKNR